MRVTYKLTVSVLALSVALSGCSSTGGPNYCEQNAWACVLAGVVVVGGIIWAISEADDDDDDNGLVVNPLLASDMRLKRDVSEVGALPNGVKLYSFRYWNDDRVFVGPSAQDLIADSRFKDAVKVSDKGYYMVNYTAIGGRVTGDEAQYQEASRKALEGAVPAH